MLRLGIMAARPGIMAARPGIVIFMLRQLGIEVFRLRLLGLLWDLEHASWPHTTHTFSLHWLREVFFWVVVSS